MAETLLARAGGEPHADRSGVDRALKVARPIADLDGSDAVTADHRAEALSFWVDLRQEEPARAGLAGLPDGRPASRGAMPTARPCWSWTRCPGSRPGAARRSAARRAPARGAAGGRVTSGP